MADNVNAEEEEAFAEAFLPEEEVDEYLAEGEEEQESEGEGEEEPPPEEESPPEDFDDANKASLLGRINTKRKDVDTARKGLPKMETSYNELYGTIPGDLSEADLAAVRTEEESHAHVAEELPEVSQAIAHEVAQATDAVRAQMEEEAERRASNTHFSEIQNAHPDIAAFQAQGSPERNLLGEWIDVHPHPEAQELERILSSGSTAEVIEMLDEFKEEVEQILQESPGSLSANAAEAVPAGQESTLIGAPILEEDDFSGAFEAALADDK